MIVSGQESDRKETELITIMREVLPPLKRFSFITAQHVAISCNLTDMSSSLLNSAVNSMARRSNKSLTSHHPVVLKDGCRREAQRGIAI